MGSQGTQTAGAGFPNSDRLSGMTAVELLLTILMYGVVPLWAAAGTADYLCHRASRIEETSGPKESMMHLLELIEAGGPLLAVLFLEVNAGVLLFMMLGLVVHQATAVWDVRYANQTREVSPAEQHVHGVMEMLPLMAVVVVAVIHWPALLSLLGYGHVSYAIELKKPPLPSWYLASVLAAAAGVGLLYVEELARTLQVRRRRLA
jgi:hypothetical protein